MRLSILRASALAVVASLLVAGLALPARAAGTDPVIATVERIADGDVLPTGAVPLGTKATTTAPHTMIMRGAILIDGVQQGDWQGCGVYGNTTCTTGLTWSTVGVVGQHTVQAVFEYNVDSVPVGEVRSPLVTITVSTSIPTVTLTTPATGQPIAGEIPIVVEATIPDDLTASAYAITITANGVTGRSIYCADQPDDHACRLETTWDLSQWDNGPISLVARLETTMGTFTSPPTVRTLANPPIQTGITIGIDSLGHVSIGATLTIPRPRTQTAEWVEVWIDDAPAGPRQSCLGQLDDHVCHTSWQWTDPIGGGVGRRLAATFGYTNGFASSVTDLIVPALTSIDLTLPVSRVGHEAIGSGLVRMPGGRPVVGGEVQITVTPVRGRVISLIRNTDSRGWFRWTWPSTSNATVRATVVRSGLWWPATTVRQASATARLTCSVTARVLRGKVAAGRCLAGGLPLGIRFSLQQRIGTTWHTVSTGRTTKAGAAFSRVMTARGPAQLRVLLPATRPFAATTGPVMRVAVV